MIGPGKDSPDALSAQLDLSAVLAACSPCCSTGRSEPGKYREGWGEKFLGKAPLPDRRRPCVWFHAVSVGEVLLLKPVLEELARRRPGWEVVISTTTPTGLAVARRTLSRPGDLLRPARLLVGGPSGGGADPADRPGPGRARTLAQPGLGGQASRGPGGDHQRPAQPAEPPGLSEAPRPARPDPPPARRRGRPDRRVCRRGSSTSASPAAGSGSRARSSSTAWRATATTPRRWRSARRSGCRRADLVFVAGSTMEGEEAAALAAYRAARVEHPQAPAGARPTPRRAVRDRSPRGSSSQGERVVRRSGSTRAVAAEPGARPPVILVDTMGELAAVWGLADVAFVGGSLMPGRGGQNMMEPAAFGAAVLFGPYTSNFREIVEQLLERGGAREVADAAELAAALLEDLDDPETAAERGAAAARYVLAQNGAVGPDLRRDRPPGRGRR